MATVGTFEILSDKFNIDKICIQYLSNKFSVKSE
jgi:hypothetical protein